MHRDNDPLSSASVIRIFLSNDVTTGDFIRSVGIYFCSTQSTNQKASLANEIIPYYLTVEAKAKMLPTTSVTASASKSGVFVASTRPRNLHASHVAPAVPRDQASVPSVLERMALGTLAAAAALSLSLAPPALAAEPFLKSTGARGPLVREEEELFRLRQEEEGKVREELAQARSQFVTEAERNRGEGQLCATPFGIDVVGITEFVALTGALVGGVSARRRKQELERLNEQLRTINTQLRQQARAGTLFAPGLTYVPPTIGNGAAAKNGANGAATLTLPTGAVLPPRPVAMPKPAAAPSMPASSAAPAVSLMSIDEEDQRPEVKQCQAALKEGKKLLKDENAGAAMVRFEKALMLAKSLGDKVRERRAVRGLAATARMTSQPRQAIKYLEWVLDISKETGDHVGDADAYGTIADIYTDIGEFEKAAEFYDKYIDSMNKDGSPV